MVKAWTSAEKEHLLDDGDRSVILLPYNNDATVEWAHTQLKTLPEFADAVDA